MADQLSDDQIKKLSEKISVDVWTSIAPAHLGFEQSDIDNLKRKHRDYVGEVSCELITRWRNKPSNEGDQAKVKCDVKL